MTIAEAKKYIEYYSRLIDKLMAAKLALLDGGAKSYTIGDRSLTRFDISELSKEIDDAIAKKEEYENIVAGGKRRKSVGIIPRDT